MPRFSIVIPCYNCAATLGATIASLMAQTVQDWEAICVDDGSTDDTLSLLEDYATWDHRIRVIRQRNAGPSEARNTGVTHALADHVAFLDADDIWPRKKLASVWSVLTTQPQAKAVFGQAAFFLDDPSVPTATSTVRPGFARLADLIGENPVCTLSNLTVSRDAFLDSGGFDVSMRYAEDLEWLIRAQMKGLKIFGTPELHVCYRTSMYGLSSDLAAMHDGWTQAIQSAGNKLTDRQMRAAEATHLRYLARRALRTSAPSGVALRLMARGVRLSPFTFLGDGHRGLLTLVGCLVAPLCPAALRNRIFA
jgi:glycosyltransferase involved in cell wall biosynthesis